MHNSHRLLLIRTIFTLLICCAGCGDEDSEQEAITSENDGNVKIFFGWSRIQDALVMSAHMVCYDLSWEQRDCKPITVRGQLEDKNGPIGEPKEFVFTFTYSASMSGESINFRPSDCKEDACILLGAHAPSQYMAEWVVPASADQDTARVRVTLSDHRGTTEDVVRFIDSLCYEKPADYCDKEEIKPGP